VDYLRAAGNIHRWRARAAIRKGDRERIQQEIDRAMTVWPGDTQLAEELVPLLEGKDFGDLADALYHRMAVVFENRLSEYPRSATLHNNLAWLSARCGRRLQDALEHARQAVALEPDSAAYLDTLAEVQFRLGDRQAAVRASRRAVQLRPGDETLRRQLERFEHEPLPEAEIKVKD
jgi:tetratricopeptide (TPR) repeat protein